ncbi:MAG TPA: transcription antitermination factor NusB [Acidimicrobiales bacterium]
MSELGNRRHHARERALEIMYEASIKDRQVLVVVEALPLAPDDYVIALLTSAELNVDRANELISEYSIDWPLERIALVDRLVMTLAIGEMLMDDAPPKAVILDEAVELAKVYSTDASPKFVNGVLSSIAETVLS